MCRRLAVLVLIGLTGLLSACQVDVAVTVEVGDDGSGRVVVQVVLDAEALVEVPDLADQLRTDDLAAVGWTVEGPTMADDGGAVLRAEKSFDSIDHAQSVLAEVAGAEGPLSDLQLSVDRPFGRVEYEFTGTGDLSAGVRSFAEAELTALLNGEPFGGNIEQIETASGESVDDQFSMSVTVDLPGASETWVLEPGGEPQALELSASEIRPIPWLLVTLAIAAVIALFILLMTRLSRWLSRRRSGRRSETDEAVTPDSEIAESPSEKGVLGDQVPDGQVPGDDVPGDDVSGDDVPDDESVADASMAVAAAVPGTEPEPGSERRLALVVLDVMGVVFETADRADDMLVEFVAKRESTVPSDEVRARYHAACEGRLNAGELWAALGLHEDPGDLTDEFLAEHRLTTGVREFLERMQLRELPVAGVGNEVGEWSRKLRTAHKLDPLTVTWLSSGDVGSRLPGPALYQRVLQVTGVDARNGLFISAHANVLDAARSYGFAVAWYRPDEPEGTETHTFAVFGSFADLGIGS